VKIPQAGFSPDSPTANVVEFTAQPDLLALLGRSKRIALSTAKDWMSALGFRYGPAVRGQYKDGHERDDVVEYSKQIYLPALAELQKRSLVYRYDGIEIPNPTGMYTSFFVSVIANNFC
jgi:hypothetical protein